MCGTGGSCVPGTMETATCGDCGVRSRVCTAACEWGPYGACGGEGICTPGMVRSQACARCGTEQQTCDASCRWGPFGACTGGGMCEPGTVAPCGGGCAARACTATCTLGECTACACDEFLTCGGFTSCGVGYHPRRYQMDGACGAAYRVTCQPDCGDTFNSCVACPSGYSTAGFLCTADCVSACGTTGNTARCQRI